MAGGTIWQMGEDPEDQRDAWRKTPGHAQGLCPVNTEDWEAAKYELIWFSAWHSWSCSHVYVGKGSWDLVRPLGGRACEIIKLVKALKSLNLTEAPVSGSTTSCHLLCLIRDRYKQYLPQENKQTNESWEMPYAISVLVFIATFFLCAFPGFRESKFSCAWMCFMFSIQLSIRSAERQKPVTLIITFTIKNILLKNKVSFWQWSCYLLDIRK